MLSPAGVIYPAALESFERIRAGEQLVLATYLTWERFRPLDHMRHRLRDITDGIAAGPQPIMGITVAEAPPRTFHHGALHGHLFVSTKVPVEFTADQLPTPPQDAAIQGALIVTPDGDQLLGWALTPQLWVNGGTITVLWEHSVFELCPEDFKEPGAMRREAARRRGGD